jgi:hypothetical protein
VSSRTWQAVGSVLSVGLVLALPASARADGPLPRLEGPAFAAPTHLHLIVGGAPPAIIDLDTGAVRVVPGVTTSQYSQIRLLPIAGGALAIVHQACEPCATTTIKYATNATGFRIGLDGSVERLGSGWSFLPARSSPAVWVLRRDANRHCSLSLVPSSRPPAAAPCGVLREDGEHGLLLATPDGEVLLQPRSGNVRSASGGGRVESRRDLAFRYTGEEMLEEQQLYLDDQARGTSRRLRWPSILNWYGGWMQQPRGSLIALEFADPAYPPSQAEDFWIFDTATRKMRHLPGFPAQVRLKFSSWGWIDDGRLVLLLQGGDRTVAAVWEPDAPAIPLIPIELPAGTGARGGFVAVGD